MGGVRVPGLAVFGRLDGLVGGGGRRRTVEQARCLCQPPNRHPPALQPYTCCSLGLTLLASHPHSTQREAHLLLNAKLAAAFMAAR